MPFLAYCIGRRKIDEILGSDRLLEVFCSPWEEKRVLRRYSFELHNVLGEQRIERSIGNSIPQDFSDARQIAGDWNSRASHGRCC